MAQHPSLCDQLRELSASMGYPHRRESTRVHAHEQQKTLQATGAA